MSRLISLGWGRPPHDDLPPDHPGLARVLQEQRARYVVALEHGDASAELPGRMRHVANERNALPCVGDFVLVDPPASDGRTMIRSVLPRRSLLERKAAGRGTDRQPIASNLDAVWIAMASDDDFSPRRLERYLALAYETGARPVVVLTKLDVAPEPERVIAEAEALAMGEPVIAISAHAGTNIETLTALLVPQETIVVVGSSGVGKSTLVNLLLGDEVQAVRAIRASDRKGMHTTTSRRLLPLPGGALLVDTPGMRELSASGDEALEAAFADVEALAASCRYGDCTHTQEPDCAVLTAIEEGTLDPKRLQAYRKLQRESAHLARRTDARARREHARRWLQIAKANRRRTKEREKR